MKYRASWWLLVGICLGVVSAAHADWCVESGSAPPPDPLPCPTILGARVECVAGESDDWHWHAQTETANSQPDCAAVGSTCSYEDTAWEAVTHNYDTGVPGYCGGPYLSYVCTRNNGGVIAGLTYSIIKRYTYTISWDGPNNTCVLNPSYSWGSSDATRTPYCPADYTPYDNRGPCIRLKRECPTCGNPIQGAGGEKKQIENDIAPVDGSLGLTRYYASSGFYASPGTERTNEIFGAKWRHSWQSTVALEHDGGEHAYVILPDGDYRHFESVSGAWVGRADKPDTLEEVVVGGVRTGWIFRRQDDSIYRYDDQNRWTTLERGGLVTALTYSDSSTPATIAPRPGLLITVTDSRGRTLSFRYDRDGFIVKVLDSAGSEYNYRYDTQQIGGLAVRNIGNVRYIDFPNTTTREYRYDESGHVVAGAPNHQLLTGIIDENAQRYGTYEYDSNRRAFQEWHGSHGADLLSFVYADNSASYDNVASSTRLTEPLGQTIRRKYTAVAGIVRDAGIDRCDDAACASVSASSSKIYSANGTLQLETDFNANTTDHVFDAKGRETQRIEASNDVTAKRTIVTEWNTSPIFNVPDKRTIKNSSDTPESQTKWSYNSRGQATARCQIDPAVSGAGSYTCGSSTNAPAGVRQTKTSYCEASDVTAGTCPLVGLVTSVNGPRLTTDAGMGSGDDITAYTYRMADDPTCASSGACTYRKGDLWKVTNALGQVTEYVSYDKNGRAKRTKDANGTLTDFTYHARGWLTDRTVRANSLGTTDPGDATLHIDYDAVGNVTKVTQPDGAYLQYTYDDAHRLIKINDNLSNSIDYCPGGVGTSNCLDAAGNRKVEQVKDPSNTVKRQLHRVYNQLGQLTQVLNAANTAVETSAGINGTGIADGYDGNGNRVYKDDGLGIRTEQDYDPLNRLKTTIQNLGGVDTATQNTTTGYTYDARDNLRQVTDPDSLNTVYTYDGLDNLTALDSPDTGHTAYTYDAAGNRISQTDNRTPSVTSTYTYDRLNRLTAVTYPTTSLNVTYAYDQVITGCNNTTGRLTSMTDATGSTAYCYDRRGNVTKKTQVTNGTTLVTQYTYTTADRLATMTYPSGGVATYTRDVLGRITGISWTPFGLRASTLVSSAAYLPFGPLTTLTFGNGRTLTKAYDQDYAIDSVSGTPAGALTLDLGVDVMGDITSASGTLGLSPPDRAYGYDALYRLKTSQTGGSSPLEAYTYNKTGDRLSASLNGGAATAYSYSGHHLTSVGGVARTYDGNGNTLTGTSAGLTLTYDDRNRLASMVNGTTSATYGITGRGERVRKTVTVSGTPTTTLFGYDEGGRLTGEYSGTGTAQAEYIYLDNIPVGVFKGGALYYIETDHLGTPRQVVKPLGNVVVWKWDFLQNTFGNSVPNQDPDGDSVQFVLGMRFPGQYADIESGLNYNYFREYDGGAGRYIESDPIGLEGGTDTYAYALSNSLKLTDPKGLDVQVCCRRLDSFLGWWPISKRHCYFIVDGFTYGLYPSSVPGFGVLGVPSPGDPRDKGGKCKPCKQKPSGGCTDPAKCIKDASDSYPVGTYGFISHNSNTFVGSIARKCCGGGVPPGLGDAPGIDDNPPDGFHP